MVLQLKAVGQRVHHHLLALQVAASTCKWPTPPGAAIVSYA